MAEVRPTGLAILVLLGCAACGDPDAEEPQSTRPNWNVLLVTLDTTRPDWLGCYGSDTPTPHIDQVAAEGARFEQCRSTAGITPMSHASILTGLNNYAHGMRVFNSDEVSHTLKEEIDTLPEILGRRGGYATAAMLSAYVVSEIYNLEQGFDQFLHGIDLDEIDTERQNKHEVFLDRSGQTRTQRRADRTVADALSWLDERDDEDRPWMMWMHLFDVHDYTLVPPDEWIEASRLHFPPTVTKVDAPKGLASHQLREELYGPELTYMDAQLGRVLQRLRDNGQYDDTIVVITADHGQGLMEGLTNHGWPKHRLLYDWCVRVPLIVRIPGERSATVVSQQVRTIDIVPTILDALSIGSAQSVHGESVLGLMRGDEEQEPRLAYADALNGLDWFSPRGKLPAGHQGNLYSACDGEWKLVWRHEDTSAGELFNLREDPQELRNLFTPDHPEVRRLLGFLEREDAWRLDPPRDQEGAAADPDDLRQLGYF